MAGLKFTPRDVGAGRARKIRESCCRVQLSRGKAGAEVPQNLLDLLSSFTKKPTSAPSPATIPNLDRLGRNVRHFVERLVVRGNFY